MVTGCNDGMHSGCMLVYEVQLGTTERNVDFSRGQRQRRACRLMIPLLHQLLALTAVGHVHVYIMQTIP